MADIDIDMLEARYSFMGECLLGSVRSFGEDSWHWRNKDTTYIYARNTFSNLRLLQMLSPTEDGGVTEKSFLFNKQGLLKIVGVTLSEAEYRQEGMQEYVLKLHQLEDSLGMDTPIKPDDERVFREALFLPTKM